MPEVILILLLVVLFVTLVGHGIWVALAWLLRGGRRRTETYEPTLSDDRAAAARYLEHLRKKGAINAQTHNHLFELLARDVAAWPKRTPAGPAPGHSMPAAATADAAQPDLDLAVEPVLESRPADAQAPMAPPDERQSAAPVSPAPRAAEPSLPPRRRAAEVLARFMAERNIRWGELVGGLLILCCSTALVISLWSQIEAIAVLRFVVFTAVTAALFGAGLFVHHRWKLPTTGRALLTISTMLVPLNLLAFAAFSKAQPGAGAWSTALELLTLLLFGWLTFLAGRVIMPGGPRLFAAGVVSLSACSLLVRFLPLHTPAGQVGAGLIPVGLYVLTMGAALWRHLFLPRPEGADARRLIVHLGVLTFACVLPLGLFVYSSGGTGPTLQRLAPLLSAMAAPGLLVGVALWRRLTAPEFAALRTSAASVALLAVALMLISLGLAWPAPARLLPALLVITSALLALQRVAAHPAVHAAVAACLTAAWVLAVHLATGGLTWDCAPHVLIAALTSAATGKALLGPAIAFGLAAAWLNGRQRRDLAACYLITACGVAALSIGLVTLRGFARAGDPARITWVYAVHAAGLLAASWLTRSRGAAWCAAVVVQLALAQALVCLWPAQDFAWPTALLAGATTVAGGAAVITRGGRQRDLTALYMEPGAHFAAVVSLLAAAWMAAELSPSTLAPFAGRMAWLSALWIGVSLIMTWPLLFAGAQMALAAAAASAVQHLLMGRAWYPPAPDALREPWIWQAHLITAGALGLMWAIVRQGLDWRDRASAPTLAAAEPDTGRRNWTAGAWQLMHPAFIPADRVLTAVVLAATVVLSLWSAAPGVVAELGLSVPWTFSGREVHACGAGSWLLLAVLLACFVVANARADDGPSRFGILVIVACAAMLLAATFESSHFVITAARVLLACALFAAAVAEWTRSLWSGPVRRLTSRVVALDPAKLCGMHAALVGLFACPVVLLTAVHAFALGDHGGRLPVVLTAAQMRIALLGPMVLVVVSLAAFGMVRPHHAYASAAAALCSAAVVSTELAVLEHSRKAIGPQALTWLVQLNALASAGLAFFWRGHQIGFAGAAAPASPRRRETPLDPPRSSAVGMGPNIGFAGTLYPRWPLLVARVSLAAVLVLSGIAIVMRPWSVAARLGATGSVWGFLAVAAVEYALFLGASPQARPNLPVTLWALCAAALSACALAPYDKSNWLCFHALAVGCAATGWLALSMCNLRRRQLLGSGWQQTFNVAAARESDRRDSVGHDLSCATCGYNLRGLAAPGRCPECDTPIARSMEHVLSRLTPQWSGQFAEVRSRATRSVLLCAGLSAVLAFRAIAGDPQRPWWSAMLLCGSAALCMTLAAWGPRRSLAYLGGLGACLAASVWFTVLHWSARLGGAENLTNLFAVNLAALALAGGAWLRIERTWLRERSLEPKPGRLPAFHRLAALLATAGAVVLAAAATLAAGRGDPLDGVGAACAVALGLTAALIFAFRDHPQFQCTCLYALGLAAVVWIIAQAGLAPRTLAGALSLGLAGYALITSAALRVWARRGEPAGDSVPGSEALRRSNSVLSVAALALAGLVILIHPGMTMRMLVCAAPLLGAGAALAGVSGAAHMRTTCLALCAAAGALAGCSWVSPGAAAAWLHRAAGVVVAGCVLITAAGLAVRCIRRVEVWREALRISVAGTAAVTGAALLFCVWVEVDALFAGRIPPLAGAAVAAVIAALAVVIVCCAVFAADERWDPLRFSARGREGYVYAGEALAVLLGLHIRATMPWLFHGFITSYWPILILGLACAALAVGQTCTRRGLAVIGRPLERTGVALPLVALLEVFIAASRVHYSLVLLTAGALYAVLAAMRRSLPLGGLAALTLNGSLWYLLHHTPGLGLTRHPQLWFVPLALAVLAAGHLNRRRLAAGQYLALNYACLMTIYLSSTADIFLVGVARAPWLPLVLAALSIAGILAGIASRLRSFLMLGTGFLCLALLTMIWHAASNLGWTWAWYVSGIALGILIITLFALLEKKRGELIAWLEQFSH